MFIITRLESSEIKKILVIFLPLINLKYIIPGIISFELNFYCASLWPRLLSSRTASCSSGISLKKLERVRRDQVQVQDLSQYMYVSGLYTNCHLCYTVYANQWANTLWHTDIILLTDYYLHLYHIYHFSFCLLSTVTHAMAEMHSSAILNWYYLKLFLLFQSNVSPLINLACPFN